MQIGLNGREWLARQRDKDGLRYRQQGNCFVWIEDYERAQELMKEQLQVNWSELLNGIAGQPNPIREEIFKRYPTDYYWTCHRSEWATDLVFGEASYLKGSSAEFVGNMTHFRPIAVRSTEPFDRAGRSEEIATTSRRALI